MPSKFLGHVAAEKIKLTEKELIYLIRTQARSSSL